ncbi:MAG: hypothetical protein LBT65_01895 [Synergistaceae bacterium]|jgi:acetyltransferase-like isoleucine patch superfamily enzyme|nr:hypothetical protein [Synergistaceae bacterium]
MKKVYIVGGNGFARECYLNILEYLTALQSAQPEPETLFGGFVGHDGYRPDFKSLDGFFVGDLAEFEFGENDLAVIGSGHPDIRKKIYGNLKKRNVELSNLIPPSVIVNEFVELGEANVLAPPCGPSVHVKIGHGNVFNGYVVIGHDARIGNFNFFGPKSQILGNVEVGDGNSVGAGSVLLPGAKIGNNNKIAPLSAVYKGCGNNCYMMGSPALKVGDA